MELASITQHDVERRVDGELLAPARQPGVLYVASQLTCLSLPERDDLVFPYPVVKYPDGHPRQGQPAYAIGLGQSVLRIAKDGAARLVAHGAFRLTVS